MLSRKTSITAFGALLTSLHWLKFRRAPDHDPFVAELIFNLRSAIKSSMTTALAHIMSFVDSLMEIRPRVVVLLAVESLVAARFRRADVAATALIEVVAPTLLVDSYLQLVPGQG